MRTMREQRAVATMTTPRRPPPRPKTVWDKVRLARGAMGPTELLLAVANVVPKNAPVLAWLRRAVTNANLPKVQNELRTLGATLANNDARAMAALSELYAAWHGRYAPKQPSGGRKRRRREATLQNLPHELLTQHILPHLGPSNRGALTKAGAYHPAAQELQALVKVVKGFHMMADEDGQHLTWIEYFARMHGVSATHLGGYRFRLESEHLAATLDFDVGESVVVRTKPGGRTIAKLTHGYWWEARAYRGVGPLTQQDVLDVIEAALTGV